MEANQLEQDGVLLKWTALGSMSMVKASMDSVPVPVQLMCPHKASASDHKDPTVELSALVATRVNQNKTKFILISIKFSDLHYLYNQNWNQNKIN